jgi:hypothetical protein
VLEMTFAAEEGVTDAVKSANLGSGIGSFDGIPGKGLSSWHTSKQTLKCRPPVAILPAHRVVSLLKLAGNLTRDLFVHRAECQFACQGTRQDLKSTLRNGARPGTVRTTRLDRRRQVVGDHASDADSSNIRCWCGSEQLAAVEFINIRSSAAKPRRRRLPDCERPSSDYT